MSKTLTSALLLALFCLTALAADIGGKWTAQVPGRGDQMHETTFTFKVSGNSLTGTITGSRGDTEIADGKVNGNEISFSQTLEFNGNSIKLLYKGTVSGDEIKFTRTREGADRPPQEFTAKRAS